MGASQTSGEGGVKISGGNFRNVWEGIGGVFLIFIVVLLSPILRPWYSKWGATESEISRRLPGDELVPQPKLESTRAITIRAPGSEVWPWLMQMGQGRGGLYTYEFLENLIRCNIHNVDRIIPELQHLEVGDKIRLGPEGYPFFTVSDIQPGQTLILRGGANQQQDLSFTSAWVFFLSRLDDGSIRLIVRSRLFYKPDPGNYVIWRVFTDPISFVMERKMLMGIKQRVEARKG